MVVEALIMGGSAVFSWCFWLCSRFVKKPINHNAINPKIYPFVRIVVGTRCTICDNTCTTDIDLRAPRACNTKSFPGCSVQEDHLHVTCTYCNSKFLMASATIIKDN